MADMPLVWANRWQLPPAQKRHRVNGEGSKCSERVDETNDNGEVGCRLATPAEGSNAVIRA